MTPEEFREIRVRLGLTQAELAGLFGVARRTIIRSEAGDAVAPHVRALYRLFDHFGAGAVAVLSTPNTGGTDK